MTQEGSTTSPAQWDRWSLRDESEINYGHLSKTGGAGIEDPEVKSGFYITTAINYTNGPAHMGHAYEAATSDVIARFQRLKGTHPAYFVTGADEHGQKIANTAADQGKEPIDICNKVRRKYQSAAPFAHTPYINQTHNALLAPFFSMLLVFNH